MATVRRSAVRRLVWLLAAIAAIAVTVALFALLYERPVLWLGVLYLVTVPIPFLAIGIFLFLKDQEAGLLLLLGTILGLGFTAPLELLVKSRFAEHGYEAWMSWALLAESVVGMWAISCFAILIGLFPTCLPETVAQRRFARAMWWLPLPMLVAVLANENVLAERVAYGELPPFPNPLHVEALAFLGPATANTREILYAALLGAFVLLIVRYRRESAAHRRQIRWVLFGAGAALAIGLVPFLIVPLLGADAPAHGDLLITISTLALPLIPLSFLLALEPPTWLDSDAVIRKSFIYGALSLGILVVYALIAAGLGLTAGAGMPVEVAIAVTAVLAFSFQPVRDRLRRIADRWVFGGTQPADLTDSSVADDPVGGTEEEVGARLAHLVRSAVRLQWVAVSIPPNVNCAAGEPSADAALTVPLTVDGTQLGEIRCGTKLTGRLTDHDARLIAALGSQSALLVANRRLAGRIVQVQEAERRRIERNLHDGAQQELVALVAKLGLARARARTGELGDGMLVDLQQEVQTILRDVRELAQGIHPSVLTDGGLVEAVEDRCNRMPISIRVSASPGLRGQRFDDDIEGAAYFFVAESLTNTLKHAHATHAHVDLSLDGADLELTVSDDGMGFDAGDARRGGLTGLADRFAALSGSTSVTSAPEAGTIARARLPIGGGS